ncbi:MAG TPA: flagellar filament capping protein FliD [Bryobacteraceae bacterium]|nr:flagellar filament capping protein FliD [Bryobacteraceae bacterium]
MGTTGSSPPSAASQAASIAAPIYFSGLSSFSSDFQSIIQRAVQIADIPVANLQTEQAANTADLNALTALEPTVSALGTDVANLGTLASTQGLSASSSDATTVSVVNTGATSPATYTVSNITTATAASEASTKGYAANDTVSPNGLLNLVVGSKTYSIDVSASGQNNLSGLAQAINNANAGVSATVLTANSRSYLSISATNTGHAPLGLNLATPSDLVSSSGTGTETSLSTYSNATSAAVSTTGQVQLVVGTKTYSVDVSGNNNLTGLAQSINAANAGVTATVTGSAGAYSLSLAASGPGTIQLNDLQNGADQITNSNPGSNATFTLSGVPGQITESSNTITDVIPGVSFTLLNTLPSGSVTLSLATDPTQLSSALETFVTDYNTLVSAVSAQQGQSAGPLQGDLIINEISSDMQSLVTYWNPTGTSTIHSLSDLGVTFNDTGQLSFDASTFSALSDTQISDAFKFLGSANTGFAALASNFTQLTDPISGMIQTQIDGYNSTNSELANEITTAEAKVTQVQQSATAQAEAADALVAELQQQQSALDSSIQSVNYVLYGRQVSANGI